jgi:glycosyltransferase involved in cell wall biosynthesis
MSTISVIIPCYNRASLVGETIKNMLGQSQKPHEIIVVDDGSTDDSAAVIESFGTAVRLIRQKNQGPGAARNAGLQVATGSFIQFMDSDDLASNNKLEVQAKALEESEADFAYSPWIRCHIGEQQIAFTDQVLQALPVPGSRPMLEWFVSGWSLVFQNCLFRRSILDKAGMYRTDLMPSEDSEYFIRILLAGARPVHTPGCLVFYREHTLNKITGAGTSSAHRVQDWTRFLEITGGYLGPHLSSMQAGTRVALGAAVKRHLAQCKLQQLPSLPANHPYHKLVTGRRRPLFVFHDYFNRINRRVKGSPDYHTAFGRKPVSEAERMLVRAIGYQPVDSL